MNKNSFLSLILVGIFVLVASTAAAEQGPFDFQQKACQSYTPAMIGGPLSQDSHLLTVRWLGTVNLELTYKGKVILLSAYYDRGPRMPSIGFTPDQVIRADYIFLGHAHFDHMSDAAQVALQTGAQVFGHQTVNTVLQAQGVPANQRVVVQNGDVFHFDGFTVEAVHIYHSAYLNQLTPPAIEALSAPFVNAVWGAPTAAEAAAENAIQAKGSFDSSIPGSGVFAYLLTFDNNFTFMFYDSMNPIITDSVKNVMQRIGGRTDFATVGYQGASPQTAIPYSLPEIQIFNPRYFIPGHYDRSPNRRLDLALEPLFATIREEMPGTTPLYLNMSQPICFNVKELGHR